MHLTTINISIHPPIFSGPLSLTEGLNIIGGENGTCKTALLNFIRGNIGNNGVCAQSQPGQLRVIAISPKRNSERRTQDQLWQYIRQSNRSGEIIINELQGKGMQLYGFDNYANTGELYYGIFQDKISDGGDQMKRMEYVTGEFNKVISQVFSEYRIVSEWVRQNGVGIPKIRIQKHGGSLINLENLSVGEQEVLSLICNIYFSEIKTDVYLIDEPEVHLNWHLEERLFSFLLNISQEMKKQFIVVTHSKVIFKNKFYSKCQFLSWENGKIVIKNELTSEQKERIAGDAIEILKLGNFAKTTFFVEDETHEFVIRELANRLGKNIGVSVCGNSSNVKSIHNLSVKDGIWPNSFFIVDGDGANPKEPEKSLLTLDRYCIENYFIDLRVIVGAYKISEDAAKDYDYLL